MQETIVTKEYLRENPDHIFVFGDNLERQGTGGAAKLRHEPNVYGFITKKKPTHFPKDYYIPDEYQTVYDYEMGLLQHVIVDNPDKTFLISRLGGGLANKYGIWESIIEPRLKKDLQNFDNVKFLWED